MYSPSHDQCVHRTAEACRGRPRVLPERKDPFTKCKRPNGHFPLENSCSAFYACV